MKVLEQKQESKKKTLIFQFHFREHFQGVNDLIMTFKIHMYVSSLNKNQRGSTSSYNISIFILTLILPVIPIILEK